MQVALTYEPEVEELAVREGWCRRVAAPAFWDHFILVGPRGNPAGISHGSSPKQALGCISTHEALFHTRGDGSATHEREQQLWKEAEIDPNSATWLQVRASTPYQALEMAERDEAYLLTDRATYLTAKKDGAIPNLRVYVESEKVLLNPCSALVNTRVPDSADQRLAIEFAGWLLGEEAQTIVREYGRNWSHGMPLFTESQHQEFVAGEGLAGRDL